MGKGTWENRGDLSHLVKLVDLVEESARYILVSPDPKEPVLVEKIIGCDIVGTE